MKITKKKLKIAVNDSIAHWERMIAWVKTRPPKEYVSRDSITRELGENWSGYYCAVCKVFVDGCYDFDGCSETVCPMVMPGRPDCGSVTCDESPNSWNRLCKTHTWEQWLFHAEKILKHLKGVEV